MTVIEKKLSWGKIRAGTIHSHVSFTEDRIRNGAKKLAKARMTTQQGRLDSFFTISHTVTATTKKVETPTASKGLKRKNGPGNETTPKSKVGGGAGRKFK